METIFNWIAANAAAIGSAVGVVLVSLAFGVLLYEAYKNRHKLVIKDFEVLDSRLPESLKSFARRVESKIRFIAEAHMDANEAASNINIFRDLAMPPQGQAIALNPQLENTVGEQLGWKAKLALNLFRWFFPPSLLLGEIFLAGGRVQMHTEAREDTVTVHCQYVTKKKERPMVFDPVNKENFEEKHLIEMAGELAYKIVLKLSPSIGLSSWKALAELTEALDEWPEKRTIVAPGNNNNEFEAVEKKLHEALKEDPQSKLIQYNLGLLAYYKYGGNNNEKAIDYFKTVAHSDDRRLNYLGQIGLARCHCQSYHRFGEQTEDHLTKSRQAADEAISLLDRKMEGRKPMQWTDREKADYARALYARAFSRHVTEKPDDIEEGVKDYLAVIALLCPDYEEYSKDFPGNFEDGINVLWDQQPPVPAVVYNNLGYILMAKGGRFTGPQDSPDYKQAQAFLKLALAREPEYKFAYANLGNLERLRGDYKEAEYHYKKALEEDPKYINGHNELAWVYLAWGKEKKAMCKHQRALDLAKLSSSQQKSKVKELFARAMWSVGRADEAGKLACEALELSETNLELQEWLQSPDSPCSL